MSKIEQEQCKAIYMEMARKVLDLSAKTGIPADTIIKAGAVLFAQNVNKEAVSA